MKKFLAIIFTFLLLLAATGCTESGNPAPSSKTAQTQNNNNEQDTPASSQPQQEEKEWGVKEDVMTYVNGKMQRVYINFSDYLGPTRGTGKLAMQNDTSLMILDAQGLATAVTTPSDNVEDIFPTYFDQTKLILQDQYFAKYQNFTFDIASKEVVTVNGYEMCKVKGSYNCEGKDGEINGRQYVAYATKTKATGAIVNWLVLDPVKGDQLGNKLDELGEKMANSFKEEELS